MALSRRNALHLALGAGALALSGKTTFAQNTQNQAALNGDNFDINLNKIIVHPINHASLLLSLNGTIIYIDPVGPISRYSDLPRADLILVTHHHDDHFDQNILLELSDDATPIIVNSVVNSRLPSALKSAAITLKNGETTDNQNIQIEAIPAYNTTPDRKQYHPEGRDNGYVLNTSGTRIYIAGDTEDIPEMRALEAIDLAFIPMILPWTMDITQAADAVNDFAPKTLYPYHYGSSDVAQFKTLVDAQNSPIDVRLAKWY